MERLIYKEKTGHQYCGTSMAEYEATDNCGTCDGVRCDTCRTKYTVEDIDEEKLLYQGYDKEAAEEAYRNENNM